MKSDPTVVMGRVVVALEIVFCQEAFQQGSQAVRVGARVQGAHLSRNSVLIMVNL